jgi:hypothetical protein
MVAVSYVQYTVLILFHLFTGWGEHEEAHGWLCAGEDLCGVPWNLISQQIVRKGEFKFFQHHASTTSLFSLFL